MHVYIPMHTHIHSVMVSEYPYEYYELPSVWMKEWLLWMSLEAVGKAFVPRPPDADMHGSA